MMSAPEYDCMIFLSYADVRQAENEKPRRFAPAGFWKLNGFRGPATVQRLLRLLLLQLRVRAPRSGSVNQIGLISACS